MKKLFVIIAAVLTSSALFAQSDAKTATPPPAPAAAPATIAPATTVSGTQTARVSHECYMLNAGALVKCSGATATPQTADVTLKNGTTITIKGVVTPKEGAKATLTAGQCVDHNGKIADCASICDCTVKATETK